MKKIGYFVFCHELCFGFTCSLALQCRPRLQFFTFACAHNEVEATKLGFTSIALQCVAVNTNKKSIHKNKKKVSNELKVRFRVSLLLELNLRCVYDVQNYRFYANVAQQREPVRTEGGKWGSRHCNAPVDG